MSADYKLITSNSRMHGGREYFYVTGHDPEWGNFVGYMTIDAQNGEQVVSDKIGETAAAREAWRRIKTRLQ